MGERIVEELGHQVTVANARRVKLISQSDSKSDQIDSELLARLGKADVKLLAPIRHRSMEAQSDLAVRIHEAIEKEDQLIERLAKKYPDVELSLATQRGRSAHRSGLPADVGGQESVQVQSNGGCTPRTETAPLERPACRGDLGPLARRQLARYITTNDASSPGNGCPGHSRRSRGS